MALSERAVKRPAAWHPASFEARPHEVYALGHKSSLRLAGAGGLRTVAARGFGAALAPGFESHDISLDAVYEHQRQGTDLVHPDLFEPGSYCDSITPFARIEFLALRRVRLR